MQRESGKTIKNRSRRPKILYAMHVDWQWIKQRPHFLAEQLVQAFDITVAYPRGVRRTHLVQNKSALRRLPIPQLPLARLKFISCFNQALQSMAIDLLHRFFRPDVIWLTFPLTIPRRLLRSSRPELLVYDCMDDAGEFTADPAVKSTILARERTILEHADVVFVSSRNLADKIKARKTGPGEIVVVRNAFGGAEMDLSAVLDTPKSPAFKILYFGTISDYLDFAAVLNCLAQCFDVEFHFIGPVIAPIPAHPRLVFHGQVEHARLAAMVPDYDCFIMPFVLNELILGVDPVKLYEYVNFGKNIICPYYPEIDRFSDFVNFYKSPDELPAVVTRLRQDRRLKYTMEQRHAFLRDNNWTNRSSTVTGTILRQLADRASA